MHPLISSCRALWVQSCHSEVSEELWLLTHPAMTRTQKRRLLFWTVPLQPHHSLPMGLPHPCHYVCGTGASLSQPLAGKGISPLLKEISWGLGGSEPGCPCHNMNPWANSATPAPRASDHWREALVIWHLISLISDLNRISWQKPEGSPTAWRADFYYIYFVCIYIVKL